MLLAKTFGDTVLEFLANQGWDVLLVISIIVIAYVGIKLISSVLTKILYKSKIDGSAIAFYIAIVKVFLWILAIFAVADVLSIPTSSLVVGLSSVALAIALALKDSLSNLANGILIIYNKPFRRGDHIEIDGVDGVIKNIKLFTTELVTYDNRRIILPNSKVVNGTIINNTSLATRRISQVYSVSYDADPDLVEKVLRESYESNKLVNRNPKVSVYLSSHGESAVNFTVKCWTDTDDYWTVYNAMPRIVFDNFAKNGISIPYNQLDVHFDSNAFNPTVTHSAENNSTGLSAEKTETPLAYGKSAADKKEANGTTSEGLNENENL